MNRGVLASVLASVMFATLYYYATLLSPLTGEEIFAWRLLLTAPGATVLLLLTREWEQVRRVLHRIRERPALLAVYIVNATVLGVQMWVFMWAPLHGRAMEVTLGFFLLPLTLVLIGRLLYRDTLSRGQKIATALAVIGVTNELLRVGGLPWPTMFVAFGYPAYFVCRRQFRIDRHGDSWLELHLLIPAAVFFMLAGPTALTGLPGHPELFVLIPGMGLISALALSLYFFAMRVLDFSMFGLLGYVEPVLLVFVALLIGERLGMRELGTYVPIWLAVAALVIEGGWRMTRPRRRASTATGPVAG